MILLIDKEKGWTSHDVVAKLRGIFHEKRIGHAGTLDPNATGLLVIGTGADTKQLGVITKNTRKTYESEIVLGKISTTDDVDGEVGICNDQIIPTESEIKSVLNGFVGEIEQIPPAFSAIRINGKKSYELARKGKEVKLSPRKVTVYGIKFVDYKYPILKVNCEVSSGTYIRSLARDIGECLETGAYLSNLRRTKVGEYLVSKAKSLQQLQKEQK